MDANARTHQVWRLSINIRDTRTNQLKTLPTQGFWLLPKLFWLSWSGLADLRVHSHQTCACILTEDVRNIV